MAETLESFQSSKHWLLQRAFHEFTPSGHSMASQRTVTDTEGRLWTCTVVSGKDERRGQDVVLNCTTPSVPEPITITVGWQWDKMAPKGLARLITAKAA